MRVVLDEVSGAGFVEVTKKGGIMAVCGLKKGHIRLFIIMYRFPLISYGVNKRFHDQHKRR